MILRNYLAFSAIALAAPFVSVTATLATTFSINGLYSTGVDNAGNALIGVADDPHYNLISQPPPGDVTATTVASPIPWGNYPDNMTSRWIGTKRDVAGGDYIYATTFNIPSEAYLPSVSITGKWAVDNIGNIFVNQLSSSTGNIYDSYNMPEPTTFTPISFTLNNTNSSFQIGNNTLYFVVNNGWGPTSLRVDGMSGIYQPVPEPLTILGSLAALGFGAKIERKFSRKKSNKLS